MNGILQYFPVAIDIMQQTYRTNPIVAMLFRNVIYLKKLVKDPNFNSNYAYQLDTFPNINSDTRCWDGVYWKMLESTVLYYAHKLKNEQAVQPQDLHRFLDIFVESVERALESQSLTEDRRRIIFHAMPVMMQGMLTASHRLQCIKILLDFANLDAHSTRYIITLGIMPYLNKVVERAAHVPSNALALWSRIRDLFED